MSTELPPTPPCLAWNHRIPNPFGYQPSLPAAIIFSTIFLGVLVTHSYQAYHFRKLWLITFVLGTLGELSGWVSRIGSHACPYSVQSFEAQLASLIMGKSHKKNLTTSPFNFKISSCFHDCWNLFHLSSDDPSHWL
jgi:hypothetical protein